MEKLPPRPENKPKGTPWILEAQIRKRVEDAIRQIAETASKNGLCELEKSCAEILVPKVGEVLLCDVSVEAIEMCEYFEFYFVQRHFNLESYIADCDSLGTVDIGLSLEGVNIVTLAGFKYSALEYEIARLGTPREVPNPIKSGMTKLWYALKIWDAHWDEDHEEATLLALDEQGTQDTFRQRGAQATKSRSEKKKKAFIEIYQDEQKKDPFAAKEGNVKTAIDRFKYRHGKISERTAWLYLKGVD